MCARVCSYVRLFLLQFRYYVCVLYVIMSAHHNSGYCGHTAPLHNCAARLAYTLLFFFFLLLVVGAMPVHQGGATSKLSCDLYHINVQLRSGETRKGKALEEIPGEREKLEEERLAILAKMQEAKDNRHDERMGAIKDHTSKVVAENVADLKSHITTCIAPLVALFGGDGSENPQDRIKCRRLQICANTAANQRDRALVKETKAAAKAKAMADRALVKDEKAKAKTLAKTQAKASRS